MKKLLTPEQLEKRREAQRKYREKYPEKARESQRAYAASEKGRQARRKRAATESARESLRASQKKWLATEAGRKSTRASQKKWHTTEAGRETLRKARKKWLATEGARERLRAARKKWRATEAGRESARASRKKYAATHRAQTLAYERAWRAKRRAGQSSRDATISALSAELGRNTLYQSAASCIPRSLPRHVRDDAIQSVILAVLEREFAEAEIPQNARRFISAAWGPHYTSLDATIPGTDKLRLVDLIASDQEHL